MFREHPAPVRITYCLTIVLVPHWVVFSTQMMKIVDCGLPGCHLVSLAGIYGSYQCCGSAFLSPRASDDFAQNVWRPAKSIHYGPSSLSAAAANVKYSSASLNYPFAHFSLAATGYILSIRYSQDFHSTLPLPCMEKKSWIRDNNTVEEG